MDRWQDIMTETLRRRRMRFRGPFYATGWLVVKVISLGKSPNERWPDIYVVFVGMAIWLVALAAYWISH